MRTVWTYLGLAVAWTWAFWLTIVVLGLRFGEPASIALFVIGAAGVPGFALGMLALAGTPQQRRDYWERLVDVRRLRWSGWLFAVLPVAVALLAMGLAAALGFTPGVALPAGLIEAPLTVLPTLLFVLVFGPLPEEMGWRGYALEPLQLAHGPLAAALLLGVVHALWHVPLFMIEGSYQYSLGGAFSAGFWRFMVSIVALSVIMTLAFNLASGSTLLAVLIHWTDNLSGELLDLPEPAEWLRTGIYLATATAIVAVTRAGLGRPVAKLPPSPGSLSH